MKYECHRLSKNAYVTNTATGCVLNSLTFGPNPQYENDDMLVGNSTVFIPGEHWNPETEEFEVIDFLELGS